MVDAATGKILWKYNRDDDPRWAHGHHGLSADIWDEKFLAATETLDYRLWLARNMGGGYPSVYTQPLAAPGGN